jgi:hypothetical protein
MRLTPEELAARKRRNRWLAFALVGFIVVVFATTVLRLHSNNTQRQAMEQAAAAAR